MTPPPNRNDRKAIGSSRMNRLGGGVILDRIVQNKKKELKILKASIPPLLMKQMALKQPKRKPVFAAALKKSSGVAVIAEVKHRSPSKGVLRKNFDPVRIAREYQKGGARALSVLTDEKFFGGSVKDLASIRKSVDLPILRKDFTISDYHVYEARVIGADAVLLIAAILTPAEIRRLSKLAAKLGMDSLVEVHTASELKKVLPLKPGLIGINNRDLKTFHVDLKTTQALSMLAPRGSLLVSESGIKDSGDLEFLKKLGVKAVLVGEGLLVKKDLKKALRALRGKGRGQG